jgi:hypothetical protein
MWSEEDDGGALQSESVFVGRAPDDAAALDGEMVHHLFPHLVYFE